MDVLNVSSVLTSYILPLASDGSDLLNVGGEGGDERSFDGDLCSSPEELVPSDWVSEPKKISE